MCGFYGINSNDKNFVQNGLNKIIHRGPDENNIISTNECSLGHVRLSIIGLDNGKQPYRLKNGYLAFNGEIYNFKELIESCNLDSSLNSDTDVLGVLYDKYGFEGMLKKIRGMFSIAVVTDNKIYLARDRYGQKPLYYSLVNGFFQFGSDLASFKINKNLENISNVALNFYLSFGFIPSPHSIWGDCFKLNPSEFIEFDLQSKLIKHQKYYDFNEINLENNKPLSTIIHNSILTHNISDVGSSLLLSGGVDSSIVAKSLPKSTECYTVKWGDEDYDEVDNARKIARKLNRDLIEVSMSKGQLKKRLESIIDYTSEPFADDGIISLDLVAQELKNKGVKVVLTGDGADEIFGGYNRYNIDLYLKILPLFMLKILGKFTKKQSLRNTAISKLIKLKGISPGFDRHYAISQLGFNDKERKKVLKKGYFEIKNELFSIYDNYKSKSLRKGKFMFDLRFLIEGNMMVKSDRVSMKSSLEFRSPFLSKEIVENALLSKKKNILFGIKKIRLKSIFVKYFGFALLQRKKGFGAPLDSVYKGEYKKMVNSVIDNNDSYIWSIISRKEFLKILEDNPHKYKRLSFHILVLNIWLTKNILK